MFKEIFIEKTDHGMYQMIRYGFVVVIAAPIDLGGYIFLKVVFGIPYIAAATISFTVSLIVNYFLSVMWVWTNHTGRQRHIDFTIFTIIGIVGLLITDLVVWFFTGVIHYNYIVSKLLAFIIVFFWSFGARRLLFQSDLKKPQPVKD